MPFVQAKCPNCGGILAVDNKNDAAICPFCEMPYVVEKAVTNYNITNNINVGSGATINVFNPADSGFLIEIGVLKSYNGAQTDIVIPDCVKEIAPSAFNNCYGLTSVVIPESVTKIGECAFKNCGNIKTVHIPDSVTEIGKSAFEGCARLETVRLSKNISVIEDSAFKNCKNLSDIFIPQNVKKIYNSALWGCDNLVKIVVDKKSTCFDSRNDCNAIIHKKSNKLIIGCQTSIVPNDVTVIGTSAFFCCKGLKDIFVPKSVSEIGKNAFANCLNLNTLTVEGSIKIIGDNAFSGCRCLSQINADIPTALRIKKSF